MGNLALIVTAAGSGSRLGARVPKAFAEIRPELSILDATLRRVQGFQGRIVVTLPPNTAFERSGIDSIAGGLTRQASVCLALEHLAGAGFPSDGIVAVHDAARCMVSEELLAAVVAVARSHDAASAAIPVSDALRRVRRGCFEEVVSREELFALQTPQAFRFGLILDAHRRAAERGSNALDDSELLANICPVQLVHGQMQNFKVTTPQDLELARRLWREYD